MKILGIDLGTTNSALAFADDDDAGARASRSRRWSAPARSRRGRRCRRSCCCRASRGAAGAARAAVVRAAALRGRRVRARARREVPQRLVSSAKSWLCNPAIDRTAQILPFAARSASSTRDDGGRRARVAGQRLGALPRAPARRVGRRAPRRAAGRAGRAAHGAGVVRRGRARADRARGARGRLRRT